jgi:hypothetical protein
MQVRRHAPSPTKTCCDTVIIRVTCLLVLLETMSATPILDTMVYESIGEPPRAPGRARDAVEGALVLVLNDLRSLPRGFTAERVERVQKLDNFSQAVTLHLVVTLHPKADA